MTRPAGPFAAPPKRKAPTVKRDADAELAEKRYVRNRDGLCVYKRLMAMQHLPDTKCEGPLDVDHVRASGGLGKWSAAGSKPIRTSRRPFQVMVPRIGGRGSSLQRRSRGPSWNRLSGTGPRSGPAASSRPATPTSV